jgi:hypothetical protein
LDKPKFGDKNIGRTPIERLIVWLEANKLLKPFINISILIVLIGWNTFVHEDYAKGFIFFLLVSFILLSGTESAESFFGSSALAVFIALHLSLYGFNSVPLVISFLIFVMFKEYIQANLLYPISTYLIFDSIFNYFDCDTFINVYIEKAGQLFFSPNTLTFFLFIPVVYIYLKIEKGINNKFRNSFMKKFGMLVIICVLFYLLLVSGFILNNQILTYLGIISLLLYFTGVTLLMNNIKHSLIALIPIIIIILAGQLFN